MPHHQLRGSRGAFPTYGQSLLFGAIRDSVKSNESQKFQLTPALLNVVASVLTLLAVFLSGWMQISGAPAVFQSISELFVAFAPMVLATVGTLLIWKFDKYAWAAIADIAAAAIVAAVFGANPRSPTRGDILVLVMFTSLAVVGVLQAMMTFVVTRIHELFAESMKLQAITIETVQELVHHQKAHND